MGESKCLISILNKLKTSSKEAVVDGVDDFRGFKEYMHVEREVQREFENIIDKVAELNKQQLILVCGSVGDGKSHLISYFGTKKNNIMDKFKIHNDATESLEPKKTSIETLNDTLNDFSDDNLGSNNTKMILAINLGTLTNFIDSDYGHRFTKLKKYIEDKKILEQDITENEFDKNSYFQYINFTDYHMFTLTVDGAKSDYINKIFNKIFSKDSNNKFYEIYMKTCCNNCVNLGKCPIKENYENLLNNQVIENIIQKLIEVSIKDKIIISTRALLNFIYDIVVESSLDNLSEHKLINKIEKYKFKDYLKSLTVNIIYDNKDASNIVASLSDIDPLNKRNEEIDSLIVNLNNTEKLGDYFIRHINNNTSHYYYKMLVLNDWIEVINDEKTKTEQAELKQNIIKFFMRATDIMPKDDNKMFEDYVYKKYIEYLYYSNRRDKSEMKKLLNFVKEVIYKWSGSKLKEGKIQLSLGRNQSKFKLYENLDFQGKISNDINELDVLHKFIKTINLTYGVKSIDESNIEISIDYSLFDLLERVNNGYRPNKKDKNNFINFVDFVDKLQQYGSHNEKILFDTKIGDKLHSYEFKIDEYGDYCLMEI